jgi:hypothetical protein
LRKISKFLITPPSLGSATCHDKNLPRQVLGKARQGKLAWPCLAIKNHVASLWQVLKNKQKFPPFWFKIGSRTLFCQNFVDLKTLFQNIREYRRPKIILF